MYVCVAPRFGEHIGRYEHVVEGLTADGFIVCGMDHQGHGCSEGDRAHVAAFAHYVTDFAQFVALERSPALPPQAPTFLLVRVV